MESLHLSVALPSLPWKTLPFSQQLRNKQCSRFEGLGGRVDGRKGLVRAKREEDDGKKRFVNLEEKERRGDGARRPLWERGLGFVGKRLGFGEAWEEDPRGQRDLEDLDLFLEGRGAEFRWKEVLEPSVENILALVLTGLFLYAVVLIGWQLLLVAAAITLSALKYAVIAALLLGLLIFFI